MTGLAHLLTDTITLWRATGHDDTGTPIFAAPEAIPGRWEDRAVQFSGPAGELRVGRAKVHLGEDTVSPGDWLAFGNHLAEPDPRAVYWAGAVGGVTDVANPGRTITHRAAVLL